MSAYKCCSGYSEHEPDCWSEKSKQIIIDLTNERDELLKLCEQLQKDIDRYELHISNALDWLDLGD